MKIKKFVLLCTLLPSLSFAQSSGEGIGTCNASLPPVDAKRCNDPSYFAEYRAAADAATNEANDKATNEIYQDNQANNDTVVSTSTDNLKNFAQCQIDICKTYFETCTSGEIEDVSARRFEENTGQCYDQSEKRFAVAKGLNNAAVKRNAQIKALTTIEEKARAIMSRQKEILIPILQNIVEMTGEWASKGSHLIRETRDVDKSTVQ